MFAALVLLASFGHPACAQAKLDTAAVFDIPAQPLETALIEFSKQASIQLMVAGDVLDGHTTQPLKGVLRTRVALATLLKGTGLGADYAVADNTVTVRREAPGSQRDQAQATEHGSQAPNGADPRNTPPTMQPTPPSKDTASNRESLRDSGSNDRALDEIVVTGTHIRGEAPVGTALITIDRDEIETSGFSTVQEVMRALPQNFGGGVSEDTRAGKEARANGAMSTALNLRGLGAGATLVLINGRRMAAGGIDASFTDISSLPLTAIDRIDVLLDGASAIYGSDAVGGVVNVILRKDFEGAETQARLGSVTSGGLNETQVGQAFGTSWTNGSALLSYEYYDRDALPASEREQTATSDLRHLGGTNFGTNQDNPGTILIGTQSWAIPRGQDGRSLTPSSFVAGTANVSNLNEARTLFGNHQRHSGFLSVNQQLSDRIEVFADGLFSTRDSDTSNTGAPSTFTVPSTNAFYVNPTNGMGPIRVAYNFIDDLGPRKVWVDVETYNTTAGVAAQLSGDWRITVFGAFAEEKVDQLSNTFSAVALNAALADSNRATAFNPFGDGSFTSPATLESLRAQTRFESDSELRTANVIAEGPLLRLPGGNARLAVGADYRKQVFSSAANPGPGFPTSLTTLDRAIRAAFIEFSVPVVGEDNARTGLRKLRLSAAGRYEDYSDFGGTTTPRVGIEWAPVDAVGFRASWSTSFKAPNLVDLDESTNRISINSIADPLSPTGQSSVLVWIGNNADLKEETAETWTAGFELAPSLISGLRLSLSYYDIAFEDRIQDAAFSQTLLTDPRFAALVTRNPSGAQRDMVCSRPTFFGANPNDCRNAPIAALLDLRDNNTAINNVTGVDLLGSYDFVSRAGEFHFELNASRLLTFEQAQLQTSPLVDLLDTRGNPIDWRLRGSASWQRRGLALTATVNYADDYTNPTASRTRAGSWTTADVQLSYEVSPESSSILGGLRVGLNAQNVFDKDPPFVDNPEGVGYDRENADLLGRFVSVQIRKLW